MPRDTRLTLRAAGWIAVALSLRAVAAVADRAVAAIVDRIAPPIPAELRAWRFAMSSSTRRTTEPMCSGGEFSVSNDVDDGLGAWWREIAS